MLCVPDFFEVTVRKAAMSDNEMQSTERANARMVSIRATIWHALLQTAGRQVDPENAEVCWWFGQVADPYGVYPNLPPEYDCIGRLYFARNSGSSVWIAFGDLPDATREALKRKTRNSLAKIDEDVPF